MRKDTGIIDDPTDESYGLKCKVFLKQVPVKDINSKGHETSYLSDMAYLVIEKNDQGVRFLNAWLPDLTYERDTDYTHDNRREVILDFGGPINQMCRASVMRANYAFPDHHLVLNSVGIIEDFFRYKLDGKIIVATSQPSSGEVEVDNLKDTSSEIHGQ